MCSRRDIYRMRLPDVGWLIVVAASAVLFVVCATLRGLDVQRMRRQGPSSDAEEDRTLERRLDRIDAYISVIRDAKSKGGREACSSLIGQVRGLLNETERTFASDIVNRPDFFEKLRHYRSLISNICR